MADRKPTSFSDTNAAGRKYKSRKEGPTLARPLRPGDPGYERAKPQSRRSESESRRTERAPTRRSSADDAPVGAGLAERARQAQIADRTRRQRQLDEVMNTISHTNRKTMTPQNKAAGGRVKAKKK